MLCSLFIFLFFFFNDTATTEIYTLSLHDALPISESFNYGLCYQPNAGGTITNFVGGNYSIGEKSTQRRSEEHTSELQSQSNLVCRLLLEKKKKKSNSPQHLHAAVMRTRRRTNMLV